MQNRVSYQQRWARYSIFELIDIDTRYLKIELIDTDTRYFEEVLNRYRYFILYLFTRHIKNRTQVTRYRYSYRRYKYLDTILGKKSIKKIGLQINKKKMGKSLQSADNCNT